MRGVLHEESQGVLGDTILHFPVAFNTVALAYCNTLDAIHMLSFFMLGATGQPQVCIVSDKVFLSDMVQKLINKLMSKN